MRIINVYLVCCVVCISTASGCRIISEKVERDTEFEGTDSESETAFVDSDTTCGDVDQSCCEEGAYCHPNTQAVGDEANCICHQLCKLQLCTAGSTQGICTLIGNPDNDAVCLNSVDFGEDVPQSDCPSDALNCETHSGELSGTKCFTFLGDVGNFCLKLCDKTPDECEPGERCEVTGESAETLKGVCSGF